MTTGEASAPGDPNGPARWDITHKIAENLDRHLVFPLLEFLQVRRATGKGAGKKGPRF